VRGALGNIAVLVALVALILGGAKAWIRYSTPAANVTTTGNDSRDPQRQIDRCVNQGDIFTPDASIDGCTAAIQSGRWSGQDLAAAFLNRGKAHANKADFDRAIADFNEAIRLNPNDSFTAAATYNRGGAYQAKGDLDRAIADFTAAIRLDPAFADAYNNRGNTYQAKGDFDPAIADFTEALRLAANDAAVSTGAPGAPDGTGGVGGNAYLYANRGAAYARKGDLDHAIADFSEAIRLDPKLAAGYHNRGNAYQAKSDFDRAIADFGEAIRLDPKAAAGYYNRGSAYQTKGDLDHAIADFDETIRLDPAFAAAYYHRGKAYADQGDLDRGLADLNEGIRRFEASRK
jgi:tetratricopeptide (TPR) repeat protein